MFQSKSKEIAFGWPVGPSSSVFSSPESRINIFIFKRPARREQRMAFHACLGNLELFVFEVVLATKAAVPRPVRA